VIGGVVSRATTPGGHEQLRLRAPDHQQPGALMPNAFLLPMNKTAAWWAKDWMERHTYFPAALRRRGRMKNEGPRAGIAAGISCLLRRTYKSTTEPAPEGAYDFVTYFECADADVPTFHQVCASLRDVAKNPSGSSCARGRCGTAAVSPPGPTSSRAVRHERGRVTGRSDRCSEASSRALRPASAVRGP
jgi:hypothetical protein